MIIESRPATDDDLVRLVGEQERELAYRYGPGARTAAVDPGERYMVAVVGSTAVGCGAIAPHGPDVVELKRMYVRPSHRGRGVARRLLSALETLAVSIGYDRIRLEAGILQPEAIGLYESSGYNPVASYGHLECNPFSRCFEKTMLVSAR
jgi:putative acetyltransferase